MRIVVNDIAASGGGALNLLESFYRYVRDFDEDDEWVFLLGSHLWEESDRTPTVVLPEAKGRWLRRLGFELISRRRLLSSLRSDVEFPLRRASAGQPGDGYGNQTVRPAEKPDGQAGYAALTGPAARRQVLALRKLCGHPPRGSWTE